MTKAFDEIAAGLEEAIGHAQGKPTPTTLHQPHIPDVKAIRRRLGMNQESFCAAFGISLGTLRHWEQGRRQPRGAARVLLQLIERNPKAVLETLQD
ncbi:putative transcriptional regulator [Methylomarinovum caldicuralii]|uniref:Transcriptional regulator n=1 Tax=Methylomarinovum caldicuralii TaxID=438856 RepID=A0AAU9C768_9GAMM|nr:NadS family protein [Methylomarinovum caldicuralii]BCX81231.1 putative transcriptional regulator [Methylomarinovum caldicuralii]